MFERLNYVGTRIKWFFEDICHWLGWDIGSYKEEPEDEEK